MPEQIHFHVALKSLEMAPPQEIPVGDIPYGGSILDKVRPKGDFYFVNPNISLREDDWIIYGVASTDNVDLQNDIVDAKQVFGDYLEEFVNVGKIFYEHGYRFAKDASPSNRIDEPIGYPYMVEIHENKLWIWAVLDKSHPLAQKVWNSLSNGDERFNQWGFSIGGLMVGQPQYSTSVYGRVRSLPKIRLYEISVTPQPMNPYTWANVVKSFISEEEMSEHKDNVEKELEKEIVNVDPEKDKQSDVVEIPDMDKGKDKDGVTGSPKAEVRQGQEVVKAMDDELEDKEEAQEEAAAEEGAEEAGAEKEEELLEALEEVAKGEEGAEEAASEEGVPTSTEGGEVSEVPQETTKEGEGVAVEDTSQEGAGGEEDNVLVDLIGGGEGENEDTSAETSGDASIELILDEIQAFRDEFEEIKARLEKLLTVEAQEHGDEELAPEEGPSVSEEVLSKSFNVMTQALDMLEFVREELALQKNMLKSLAEKFESLPVVEIDVEKSVSTAEEALKARDEFSPENAKVSKSVTSQEEVEVPEEGTNVDPIMKSLSDSIESAVSEPAKDKFEEIMKDPELLEITKSLVNNYEEVNKKLSEGKIKMSTHRTAINEILVTAREVLGLNRAEFESLTNKA